jgi:hypothetical protein
LLHRDDDVMDTKEETPCGAEVTNRIRGGCEDREGTGNDEKISEEKDMSAGQKV